MIIEKLQTTLTEFKTWTFIDTSNSGRIAGLDFSVHKKTTLKETALNSC